MKRIAIIGSGIGGLTAGILLAQQGHSVTILEKNPVAGGKVASFRHDGFTFDLGPTLITLLEEMERIVPALTQMVRFLPVDPSCKYFWSDGTAYSTFADPQKSAAETERVFPEDSGAVEQFLRDTGEIYRKTKALFLLKPFGPAQLANIGNAPMLPAMLRIHPLGTMAAELRRRFRSPKLRQLFGRFATYNGSSPYRAPSMLNVIASVELRMGAWYPAGGVGAIGTALAKIAASHGVAIHTDTEATGLLRSGQAIVGVQACGVRTGNLTLEADAVVSNGDARWTHQRLLAPVGVPTPRGLLKAERSCSGYLLLAAVRAGRLGLAHHNVFFSDDYPAEFADIFERRQLPRGMTIYLSISAFTDPQLAPEGWENWYILINAPANGIDHDNPEVQARYAQAVWERLERGFGIKPEIAWQVIMPARSIEQRYHSLDGAIYGTSSNSLQSAFLRPNHKVRGLKNFYLAGGSTHPGGGVPLAMLSGNMVAEYLKNGV